MLRWARQADALLFFLIFILIVVVFNFLEARGSSIVFSTEASASDISNIVLVPDTSNTIKFSSVWLARNFNNETIILSAIKDNRNIFIESSINFPLRDTLRKGISISGGNINTAQNLINSSWGISGIGKRDLYADFFSILQGGIASKTESPRNNLRAMSGNKFLSGKLEGFIARPPQQYSNKSNKYCCQGCDETIVNIDKFHKTNTINMDYPILIFWFFGCIFCFILAFALLI